MRTISAEPVYDAATDSTTLTLSEALSHRHFAGVIDSQRPEIPEPMGYVFGGCVLQMFEAKW